MSDVIQTKILYIERNILCGFSIHKVFQPIIGKTTEHSSVIEVPYHRADFFSLLKNLLFVFLHRNTKGVNHITGDMHYLTMALCGCKTVLTVHDLVTLKLNGGRIKKWLLKTLWYTIPLRQADHITCISNTTRNELLRLFNLAPEKVSTIYNAVDTAFHYVEKDFNYSCPRILHIGTGWNKNLNRVIEALEGIPCTLVIIGQITSEQICRLNKLKISFEQKENLSDEQIVREYEKCDIVSFPSLYEGFGMPIIEGQTVGRAVLTSNREPMCEIAASGAVYVDPESVESIRQGFINIITNEELRKSIVQNGIRNVQRFTPDKIVADYNKIYEEL